MEYQGPFGMNQIAKSFPGGLAVKNLPMMQEMQETWFWSLDWEDPLEEEMATHFNILAGTSPCTEETDGLQSMGSQTVEPDWVTERANVYGWFE